MEEIISACGLICTECPAYIATLNDDDELRTKTANEWSKMYGATISPDDVNCVGCLEETGRHIGHWDECEIHKCTKERELLNCAYCDDYGCEKITGFFKMAPEAEKVLSRVREIL